MRGGRAVDGATSPPSRGCSPPAGPARTPGCSCAPATTRASSPRIAFQNDDYGAILGFVAAGVGVALVPDMVTRAVRGDVVIRELDPAPPPRPISVILPSGYRSPAAAAMLAVLRDVGQAWVRDRPALAERPAPSASEPGSARAEVSV